LSALWHADRTRVGAEGDTMRKLLMAFGLVALAAAPAVAKPVGTTIVPEGQYSTRSEIQGPQYRVRLDKSIFGAVGPSADVNKLCGPAGARAVSQRTNGGDVALSILTLGFYTPTHAHVACNTSRHG
jgi:hypothetical protein